MYGAIIGDIVGSVYEFDNIKTKDFPLFSSKSTYTDDSIMTIAEYLVKGNHDTKSNSEYRKFGFEEVYDHPIIIDGFWILSHDALYVNSNMPYANLFGHVHNSPIVKDYSNQHYCVSVERINYTPIEFNAIKRKIKEASISE